MSAKETLENLYGAIGSGDMAAAAALTDANLEWIEAAGHPYGGTYRGFDAVVEGVFARGGRDWTDFKAVPDYIVGDDERAIGVGTYSGTYTATGKSFSARFAHAVVVRNGKVVHFEQIVDSVPLNAALAP